MKKSERRMPGDGSLFQRANGLWVATLEIGWGADGTRRRWQGTSKTQNGALAKLREAREEVAATGTVSGKSMTVAAYLEGWLETVARPNVRPKTFEGYAGSVRRHIIPALGKYRIAMLTAAQVRGMEHRIASGGHVEAARKAHRVLRTALEQAVKDGVVSRNVAAVVDPPRSAGGGGQALTAAEARTVIADTAETPMGVRWHFALLTGARQAEALGLEWDRVDLKAGTVDISWQLQRIPFRHGCAGGCGRTRAGSCPSAVLDVPPGFEHRQLDGGLCLTRPKTAKGQRIVPLAPALLTAMTELRRGRIGGGLVWTRDDGRPIPAPDDAKAWHDVLAAASVRDVPLHSARHTMATLLMEAGVDSKVIQEIMGHAQLTTTDIYKHADLTMRRAAVARIGQALA